MKELKLNRLNKGESQETFSDKVNQNFNIIDEFLGGPIGRKGSIGPLGQIGSKGPIGSKGSRGKRGALWFFQVSEPTEGILDGDYWIDSSNSNMVYMFIDNIWVFQNIKLIAEEQFLRIIDVGGEGIKDTLVQSTTNPIKNTLVFNSIAPDLIKLNPQYSKIVVETSPKYTLDFDQSTQPLIEFSKTNEGYTGDYDKSPIIRWGDSDPIENNYDLVLDIRRGGMDFHIGGDLKTYSNQGKVLIESETSSIKINNKGLNLNSIGDINMTHIPGTFDPLIKAIKIESSNFNIGQGPGQDYSNINSPIEISRSVDGYNKPALVVKNYLDKRGDGIHINVDYNSKNGYLWNSKLNNVNILSLDKEGEMKIIRKTGIVKKELPAVTETHGTIGGITYNWHGIYPSTANASSSFGKIEWDGEEDLLLSSANPNRGVYVNVHELGLYYIGKNKSLTFSIKNRDSHGEFKIIGIGGGTGPTNHYPDSSSQYDVLSSPAFMIDIHIVQMERFTANTTIYPPFMENVNEYCLYYEAHGITGGIQTGKLIYKYAI